MTDVFTGGVVRAGVGIAMLALLGAGCGQANALEAVNRGNRSNGMISPYSTQSDGDVGSPIVTYQEESDLSRMAKLEAAEKASLKDAYQETQGEEQEKKSAEQTSAGPKNITNNEVTKPMKWEFPGALPAAERVGKKVVMETTKGVIEFEVFGEEAPLASSNFIYLSKGGYYDGLTFHRREEGFVIQGGDPRGNGTGGPGYQFEDEPVKRKYDRGIVAMANAGPDTNGSQFFIMLADVPLPPKYTIFGKVTKGMDVVDAIKVGDKMTKVSVK